MDKRRNVIYLDKTHEVLTVSLTACCLLAIPIASSTAYALDASEINAANAEPHNNARLTDDQRAAAVETMRRGLKGQERWLKVRAAEYLLGLDYPQEVMEEFHAELEKHGEEPGYRIGIWRVLALGAMRKEHRNKWVSKIRNVALDDTASDQEQAIEALDKLNTAIGEAVLGPKKQQLKRLQQLSEYSKNGSPSEQITACEGLARLGNKSHIPELLDLLDSPDVGVQLAASYALCKVDRRSSWKLSFIDWAIIAAYALGMLGIGWYYSRRSADTEDYLLGGRTMRPTALGLSLFATMLSTISYLFWPGEMIQNGPMILCVTIGYPFMFITIGYFVIPKIMSLRVTSAYEILETRLGLTVRILGSSTFLLLRLLWMAVIIYATAGTILVPLMGLDASATPYVCAAMGAITVIYTSMGGLKAVVFADVVQTFILFSGAIAAVVLISLFSERHLGGAFAWWPTHWPSHWQEPSFAFDPFVRISAIAAILAQYTWYVCTNCSDQMAIQRYLATKDANAARKVILVSLCADFGVAVFLCILGLALLSYFRAQPHLLGDNQMIMANADQLFPRFIAIGLPVGASGLVIAGLLAAAMSSLSSGINSSCSVIYTDFIDRFRVRGNHAVKIDHVHMVKYISVFVGAAVVVLSTFVCLVEGNLLEVAYKVVNLLTVPLAGLFLMAMFIRWSTAFGTIVGAVAGLAVVVAVNYWEEITGKPGISFMWAMPIAIVVQMTVGMIASIPPFGRRACETEGCDCK